jgi:hypothetical protein
MVVRAGGQAIVAAVVSWAVATTAAVCIMEGETEGDAQETEGTAPAPPSAVLGGAGFASAGFTTAQGPMGRPHLAQAVFAPWAGLWHRRWRWRTIVQVQVV